MEVSYKRTYRDWQEGYRVGLSHLTPAYRIVWTGLLLLFIAGPILILISDGYPATWPPTGPPSLSVLLSVGFLVGVILASYFTVAVVVGHLNRSQTIQLLPRHFAWKRRLSSNLIPWKDVTDILETGDHICFCQNIPTAVVVPKSAFPDPQQARAFVEQAEHYWRRGTGRKDPSALNALGVWPPAPRVPDSQAQGRTPKQ